jgi:hypothetical protein
MEKIHNLYITSTHKQGSDTNYNFNLYLSSYGIKIADDEDAYLNITSFQSLNSFYNINDNSKSFIIKVKTDVDITFTYNLTLETGNYDIFEFENMVNNICSNYFTITYNKNKNKWNYIKNPLIINSEVILIVNSYNSSYFGLPAFVNNFINAVSMDGIGTLSSIINMNNFMLVVIRVLGLVEQNKSIDNFNKSINRGDTGLIINRQDTPVGGLINWTAINNSFMKKISNLEINQITFLFYNEYNSLLTDIDNWVMTLQIIIKKKIQYQLLQSQME